MAQKRKLLTFFVKVVFSCAVLLYVIFFNKASIRDITATLRDAEFLWLAVSLSLHSLGLLISAIRWQILIRAQGDDVPLSFLTQSYLVGSFFNLFLPTRIGGDVVRIWDGSRYSKSLVKSSAIIVVERLTGILALFVFALAASIYRLDMAPEIPVIWAAMLVGFGGILVIFIYLSPVSDWTFRLLPDIGFLARLKQKAFEFKNVILSYRSKKRALFYAFFWGFLLQVNVIVHYYLIGKALGLDIPFLDYFVFIPIVHLILLIPFTINGLGLREGSNVEIFKFYGIDPVTAIAFSLVDWIFMLLVGVIGGIIYAIRKQETIGSVR